MNLRRVDIEHFRGINKLEWTVSGSFVCLLGPGDSTKTTILDAVELALSPRWNIVFDDMDFYNAKTDQPLRITATVGALPEGFKSDAKYGHLTRGWSRTGDLHDEPDDDDELVLSIRLMVTPALEPTWVVVNDRNPDGVRISADDREKLGCTRLGEFLDRHLSWARGSIISRLTSKGIGTSGILADAGRAARQAFADTPPGKLTHLYKAAGDAARLGKDLGVATTSRYKPHLDVQSVSMGLGGLSLHDGDIPLRRAGLGTRRLLAVAIQQEVAETGGVSLIDEVELGLEPHRIRHLLRTLSGTDRAGSTRHVLMTTHAPVVLEELLADQLRVVRSEDGVTRVLSVDAALQPIIRRTSEAFFARKVLVCEGRTELGFCRRLDRWWAESGESFGLSGIALADGGGRTEAPRVAKALADLEYHTALLGDSDQPITPDRTVLQAAGVTVIQWDGGMAFEGRIARDLPWIGVAAVVSLAMDLHGEQCVRDAIANAVGINSANLAGDPSDWLSAGLDEFALRGAIGDVAQKHKPSGKKEGWFKRVDWAEDLTTIIIDHWATLHNTDLRLKIETLKAWAHGS